MLERTEADLVLGAKLDARFMLSWEQIAGLHQAGHIIGAHTRYHPNLAHLDADRARSEMAESKADLEKVVGQPVVHFAYPAPLLIAPHCSENTVALTRQLGYQTAVTCLYGAVRRSSATLALPRVAAPLGIQEFRWALEANMLGYTT